MTNRSALTAEVDVSKRRVAVIGSGISGLAVAYKLAEFAHVTLFEAGSHFGGHTNTVDVTLDGHTHGVDTGFLVLNERTYPNLLRLFGELGVELAKSDMSFSAQVRERKLEWCGSDLNALFAQRCNLLRPRFWRMLADIVRFNRLASALAHSAIGDKLQQSIGEFLVERRFSEAFREDYLLPMIGCIWSCPTEQMLDFPMATMIRFCHNHGLLQISKRPQWLTVKGGARNYVERMLKFIPDARLNTPVHRVRRLPGGLVSGGVMVGTAQGQENFDEVVLACHSDQSLALLAEPSADERAVLGAIGYHANRAVLHTDTSVLPRRRRAWAAWNYERATDPAQEGTSVCLHYLINRLQPLPFSTPVVVSLNPITPPRADAVLAEIDYAHPVFDQAAIAAQRRVPELQGQGQVWFCGAWTRYGFHEDGLISALAVCDQMRARWATTVQPQMREAA